ncbi:hypothetical protein O0544_14240 [Edwardsiella anguillarum]|nr:hypothetical protein [Edwardsiella anguillarum]
MDIVIDAKGELRVSVIRTAQITPHDRIIGVSFIPDSLRQQEQGEKAMSPSPLAISRGI